MDSLVTSYGLAPAVVLLLKLTLFLTLIAVLVHLLRGFPAALRHLVLLVGVCGSVPIATWQVGLPSWELPVRLSEQASAAAGERVTAEAVAPTGDARDFAGSSGAEARPSAAAVAVGAWAAGALFLLLRTMWGAAAAGRLMRGSTPIVRHRETEAWRWAAGALGVRRQVRLLEGPADSAPATWGFVSPCVLLPPEAVRWPTHRLRVVLLHEAAHVARWDCATQLVADCARALLWMHPQMWWACSRLREERERACDELVVGHGISPHDYAAALLEIVRGYLPVRGAAALSMAGRRRLATRVQAILLASPGGGPGRGSSRFRAALIAALSAVALVLGAMQPVAQEAHAAGLPTTSPVQSSDVGAGSGAVPGIDSPAAADAVGRTRPTEQLRQESPEPWRTGGPPESGPARLSCWVDPDGLEAPSITVLFVGTLQGSTWLRLERDGAPARGMRTASITTAAGDLSCSGGRHVGIGLAGVWGPDQVASLRYSPNVRLLFETPAGPAREIRLPETGSRTLCRLTQRAGELDLECRSEAEA